MANLRDPHFWRNLTKDERREFMQYQTAPCGGGRSAYLPDDCSECPVCSQPVLGSGLCQGCDKRFERLIAKGEGRA